MAYQKIDTNGKDVVVSATVYMPNGSRETFRYRMNSPSGSVKRTDLNHDYLASLLRNGLVKAFGPKGVKDE